MDTFNDSYGRPTWTRDADGHVTYTGHDVGTGAVIETIQDVDYTKLTPDQQSAFPSGWTHPTGGLHLDTKYTVDGLGRTTEQIDPNLNKTYTVYLDASHETRVYPGFDGTNTTGPIQISREYWPASGSNDFYYAESLTSSATPHLTNGVPDGAETLDSSNIQSLSRDFTNSGGQVTWSDKYFTLSGLTYAQAVAPDNGDLLTGNPAEPMGAQATFANSWTGQFYRTVLGYDDRGRQNRVTEPTGTIHINVLDGLGRVVSKWTGTDASHTGDDWTPATNTGNMMDVEDFAYDASSAPSAPHLLEVQSASGLPAATYYVKVTYIINGVETPASAPSFISLPADETFAVASPPAVAGATAYNVYASTIGGQEVFQGNATIGNYFFESTGGLIAGAAPPLSGVGDGQLTLDIQHPGLGQPDRTAQTLFDWRDRPVESKQGVQYAAGEDTSTHRPITCLTPRNLRMNAA